MMTSRTMSVEKILRELEFLEGNKFPRAALQSAIAQQEQVTPELLKIMKYASENAEALSEQEYYMAPIYALYLLAQFREKSAYPLIVDFFSIPGDVSLDLTGDVVTEDLNRILASVSHGDMSLMKRLAENRDANEYVRNAALSAMLVLVVQGAASRDEVMLYYENLFRGGLERELSHAWSGLIYASTRLYPEEVYEDIQRAFENGLAELFFIGLSSVEQALARGKEQVLTELQNDTRYTYIEDTIAEMEWWACFREPKVYEPPRILAQPQPVTRTQKVGRNDPCPCGSGKKYKKCCGKAG